MEDIENVFLRIAEAAKDGLRGSDCYAKDRLVFIRKLAELGCKKIHRAAVG